MGETVTVLKTELRQIKNRKIARVQDLYESTNICIYSVGFRVGGTQARLKRGPSDDVTICSQP